MQATKNENIDWISNLRWIALYAVIILHCTSPLLGLYGKVAGTDWWIADLLNAAVRFAVPVFVMITGALLLHRDYEIGSFLKKRLSRVVLPFLFWSLVYIWYSWYNEEITFGPDAWAGIRLVLHLLKNGASYHLWYVYMLIGLYFFIPVISKFVRNAAEKEIFYFLLVWFGVMMINQPYLVRFNPSVDMHYFIGFVGYLVLGHYLAFKDFSVKYISGWMMVIFALSTLVIAVGTRMIITGSKYPGTMFYEPVSPFVCILSASVFLFGKSFIPKAAPFIIRVRDLAGNYNYGVYLSHALVLYFLDDLFGISYKLCTPIVAIPVTALICFGISLLLVLIINKIPFGKWVSG